MLLGTEIATDGAEVGIVEVTIITVVTVGIARRIEAEKGRETETGITDDLIPAAPIRETMTGGLLIAAMPTATRRTKSLTRKRESTCLYFSAHAPYARYQCAFCILGFPPAESIHVHHHLHTHPHLIVQIMTQMSLNNR